MHKITKSGFSLKTAGTATTHANKVEKKEVIHD
jgi:hypothetical protein